MSELTLESKVEQIKHFLKYAESIKFTKLNGDERELILGTPPEVNVDENPEEPKKERKPLPINIITVYEKDVGWRSFDVDNLISITFTDKNVINFN